MTRSPGSTWARVTSRSSASPMITLSDLQSYAPGLGLTQVSSHFFDEADAWAKRVTAGCNLECDPVSAEAAYVLHLLSKLPPTVGEVRVTSVKVGGQTTSVDQTTQHTALTSIDWKRRAYAHLAALGCVQGRAFAGVKR